MLFIGILLYEFNFEISRFREPGELSRDGWGRRDREGVGGQRNKIEGRRMAEKRGEGQKTNDTKRK